MDYIEPQEATLAAEILADQLIYAQKLEEKAKQVP